MDQVAAITVVNKDKILMGIRRDNKSWTNPGGHVEKGESPKVGAKRELLEEAGINLPLSKFKHQSSSVVDAGKGKKLKVHSFRVDTHGAPPKTDSSNDPDEEVAKWKWIKPHNAKMLGKLHVPIEKNVVFKDLMENGMLKKAYALGEEEALNKIAKAIPGGNFSLMEMLAQKKAGKSLKSAVTKPKPPRPVVTEAPALDYSTFNKTTKHKAAANPEPKPNWNLI